MYIIVYKNVRPKDLGHLFEEKMQMINTICLFQDGDTGEYNGTKRQD